MIDKSDSLIKMNQFRFWCQKVLPLVYDDSLSYYELLCKVVKYINDLIHNDQILSEMVESWNVDIDAIEQQISKLQEQLNKYADGELIPEYVLALQNFIDENLEGIIGRIVKFVSFGINEQGYFVALVPKTWNFIHFDTIIEPSSELYGHLILQW